MPIHTIRGWVPPHPRQPEPARERCHARRDARAPRNRATERLIARGMSADDARLAHKATVAIIVAVLALGTGANALIFSMFQSEFVRPAPAVPNDVGLTRIWGLQRATTTARWEP